MTSPNHEGPMNDWMQELFGLVERSQGQAFISDGDCPATNKAEFVAFLESRIRWTDESLKLMRQFRRKILLRKSPQ